MQLDLFPTTSHLRCIDPAKNKRRFYALQLQKTLFGQWAVVREWGRIGSRVGQRLEQWFDDPAAAHAFMNQLEKTKRLRGYG